MKSGDRRLELSGGDFRELAEKVLDRVTSFLDQLEDAPASYDLSEGPALSRSLRERLPSEPSNVSEVLDTIFERAVPGSFNTAGPGYLAYIPGGGVPFTALASLIADVVNRYVGVWVAAPGLVQIESNVIRWFCRIVGYPEDSGGYLSSGGSLANFSAMVTARVARLPENFLDGTLYASDQIHHSVQKAALLAGFPARNIRSIPSDDRFRIRIDELESTIAADREEGLTPFMVIGSAGTTNSGAVDDFPGLADVSRRENLWFHIDAAYGGFFMMTERGRRAMAGLELSDSVTLDPHKGLFLPYGTGCLLTRHVEALRNAHSVQAAYMPQLQDDHDRHDFCEVSPELSRGFRGLRAWLPLKLCGLEAFRSTLDEKLDLIDRATEQLRSIPQVEIVAEPQLSVVAFRLRAAGLDRDALNGLNRSFLEAINARRRVFLTGTVLQDLLTLRICVLSFRTHSDRIDAGLEDIRSAAEEVLLLHRVTSSTVEA